MERQIGTDPYFGSVFLFEDHDKEHASAEPVRVDRDALRAVLAALVDAQAYILHPASVTPSASKRVATHRVPVAEFHALTSQIRVAATTLGAALRCAPS